MAHPLSAFIAAATTTVARRCPTSPATSREENFANWIPTLAGMEIHFADYERQLTWRA
ncbi:MAG TPA: hypothetical protein VIO95_02280 [Mycobacterium sp.]